MAIEALEAERTTSWPFEPSTPIWDINVSSSDTFCFNRCTSKVATGVAVALRLGAGDAPREGSHETPPASALPFAAKRATAPAADGPSVLPLEVPPLLSKSGLEA